MRSGAPAFGTPEYTKAAQASGQLARRIGVPFRSSNVCAANEVDAQAAYESQMALWGALMGGAHLVEHAAGWLHGGLTASFEKLILDAEMLQMMEEYFRPIEVSPATMALEASAEVGPGVAGSTGEPTAALPGGPSVAGVVVAGAAALGVGEAAALVAGTFGATSILEVAIGCPWSVKAAAGLPESGGIHWAAASAVFGALAAWLSERATGGAAAGGSVRGSQRPRPIMIRPASPLASAGRALSMCRVASDEWGCSASRAAWRTIPASIRFAFRL